MADELIDDILSGATHILARNNANGTTGPNSVGSLLPAGAKSLLGYLQPADLASGTITPRTGAIDFSGGSTGHVLTVQGDGSLALQEAGGGGGISWSTPVDAVITPDGSKTRDIGTDTALFRNVWVEHIQQKHSATNAWEMGSRPIDNYDVVLFQGKNSGNQFALDLAPAQEPASADSEGAWIDIGYMPLDNGSSDYQVVHIGTARNLITFGCNTGSGGTYGPQPLKMSFAYVDIWGPANTTAGTAYKYWTFAPQSFIGFDAGSSTSQWMSLSPTDFKLRGSGHFTFSEGTTGNVAGQASDVGFRRVGTRLMGVSAGSRSGAAHFNEFSGIKANRLELAELPSNMEATLVAPVADSAQIFMAGNGSTFAVDGTPVYRRQSNGSLTVNFFPISQNTTGGSGSAGAGNQYVEVTINGVTYKLLHDGTV